MCTVTFVPAGDRLYITSNRDEKQWRPAAAVPEIASFPSGKILFPKDPHAGGTWIAVHENGNALVFLNGGALPHKPQPPYRKSRGLILLDLIDSFSPVNSFMAIKLNNIEPFTAVIWEEGLLFECRWDGKSKHQRDLNASRPHIWSSVTLYDETVISKRKEWFNSWVVKNDRPDGASILDFHRFTGDGDPRNDLLMNRDGQVFTVSVTQVQLQPSTASMQYLDLQQQSSVTVSLLLEKTMADQ